MHDRSLGFSYRVVTALMVAFFGGSGSVRAWESWKQDPWTAGAGISYLGFDGDTYLESGPAAVVRVGYDFNRWLGLEGSYYHAWGLEGNSGGPAPHIERSWTGGLAVDGLLHLTRDYMFNPYMALGGWANWYHPDVADGEVNVAARIGAGVMYRIDYMWGVHLDGYVFLPPQDVDTDFCLALSMAADFGAPKRRRRSRRLALDRPLRGDRSTSPGNSSSWWPFSRSGSSTTVTPSRKNPVRSTATPTRRTKPAPTPAATDTPKGRRGQSGSLHHTTLYFSHDSTRIERRHYAELDRTAAFMVRNPGTVALIEGHSDRAKGADPVYNRELSTRRARAAMNYLSDVHGIARRRLKALGWGYDKPKVTNDPVSGSPVNRRVEVRILAIQDAARLN